MLLGNPLWSLLARNRSNFTVPACICPSTQHYQAISTHNTDIHKIRHDSVIFSEEFRIIFLYGVNSCGRRKQGLTTRMVTKHVVRMLSSYIRTEKIPYDLIKDHYSSDVTMGIMASQNTDDSTVCSSVCLDKHQRKHQSSLGFLPFVRGIHRSPVDSPHKGPFPFDDVIIHTERIQANKEMSVGLYTLLINWNMHKNDALQTKFIFFAF